jgi:Uma2 family endonuclease
MAMPNEADWSWLRAAAQAPEMTLEVYESLPEGLARGIEVVDGTVIVCHSPSDKHQAVQYALLNALSEAVRKHDQEKGTCHRVRAGIDVLLTEVPLHFRTPDLTVFRCLGDDQRGRWKGNPKAADAIIVVEVVSPRVALGGHARQTGPLCTRGHRALLDRPARPRRRPGEFRRAAPADLGRHVRDRAGHLPEERHPRRRRTRPR